MKAFTLLLLLFSARAFAGVDQLSREEFEGLARELAPKVNLFRDAWKSDPEAQFYGGTTRDYLYWLKGKFREAHSPEEARAIADELRSEPVIDVREFIYGESDVDIFSHETGSLRPEAYGVRKIDFQAPDVLEPSTELGKNERSQGFIPAEKIRLGREGFAAPGELGDGLKEIYTGKLTVHFASPEEFATTKYAKEGLNHPILLALRYLRLQAIDYFQSFGQGLPDRAELLARIDADSAAASRKVIENALDGEELKPYLQRPKFRSWLNGGIQKAFRSYTNPDAAREIMTDFRVSDLPTLYPQVEPINQYVFRQSRDEAKIGRALAEGAVNQNLFYRPAKEEFPDGFLYHGTKDEKAFRSILFQGVLGSSGGSAGEGLYGVAATNREFAEKWGGDPKRLLRFPVKEDAKIVDITQGEGQRVWNEFMKAHPLDFEKFAETYGIDALKYPYNPPAFVVKNSAALGRAEGVHRQILSLRDILARAAQVKTADALWDLLEVNNLNEEEVRLVLDRANLPAAALEKEFRAGRHVESFLRYILPRSEWAHRDDLVRLTWQKLYPKATHPPGEGGKLPNELQPLLGFFFHSRDHDDLIAEFAAEYDPRKVIEVLIGDRQSLPRVELVQKLAAKPENLIPLAAAMEGTSFIKDGGAHWRAHPDVVELLVENGLRLPEEERAELWGKIAQLFGDRGFVGNKALAERVIAAGGLRQMLPKIGDSVPWSHLDRPYVEEVIERALSNGTMDDQVVYGALMYKPNLARRDWLERVLGRGKADDAIAMVLLNDHRLKDDRPRLLKTLLSRDKISSTVLDSSFRDLSPGDYPLFRQALKKYVDANREPSFEAAYDKIRRYLTPELDPAVEAYLDRAATHQLLHPVNAQARTISLFSVRAEDQAGRQFRDRYLERLGREKERTPERTALLRALFARIRDDDTSVALIATRVAQNPVWAGHLAPELERQGLHFLDLALAGSLPHSQYAELYALLSASPHLAGDPAVKAKLHRLFAQNAKFDRYLQSYPALLLRRAGDRSPEVSEVIEAYRNRSHLEGPTQEFGRRYEAGIFDFVAGELKKLELPADCAGRFARVEGSP